MSAPRDRINVIEYAVPAAFYDRYIAAHKNGKSALHIFWHLLRHQLNAQELDPHFAHAYKCWADHGMSIASTGCQTLRLSFNMVDKATKEAFDLLSARYGLSKTDTVKLLLIADTIHAGSTDVLQQPTALGPARSANSTPVENFSPAPAAATPVIAEVVDKPKTRFCQKTNAWLIFKSMRFDSSMTGDQLMEVKLTGGAFVTMTDSELSAHGLSNPSAESSDSATVKQTPGNVIQMPSSPTPPVSPAALPIATSQSDQDAFARSLFAAADLMLERAA